MEKTLKTFLVFQVFLLYLHRNNLRKNVKTGESYQASRRDDCRIGS